MKKQKCSYCDNPAKVLCDFILAIDAEHGFTKIDMSMMTPVAFADQFMRGPNKITRFETCDKPMCEEHVAKRWPIFCCGKDAMADTQDFCELHADLPEFDLQRVKCRGPA